MKVQFELSFEDYRRANALARRTHSAGRLGRWSGVLAPIGGGSLLLVAILSTIFGPSQAAVSLRPAWIVGVAMICFPLLVRFGERKAFRRAFPSQVGDHLITITVDETGVSSGVPGLAESRYGWEIVRSMVEDHHTALIYVAQVNFLMLPKRAVSLDQLHEVREMINRHGLEVSSC